MNYHLNHLPQKAGNPQAHPHLGSPGTEWPPAASASSEYEYDPRISRKSHHTRHTKGPKGASVKLLFTITCDNLTIMHLSLCIATTVVISVNYRPGICATDAYRRTYRRGVR